MIAFKMFFSNSILYFTLVDKQHLYRITKKMEIQYGNNVELKADYIIQMLDNINNYNLYVCDTCKKGKINIKNNNCSV